MNNLSSHIFPVVMLTLLASLSFGLQHYVREPETQPRTLLKHEADAIISALDIHQIDSSGHLKYRLRAPKMLHYADDDTSFLENPRLESHRTYGPATKLSANQAHINSDSSEVLLTGNVVITRPAFAKQQPLQAKMAKLTVYPDDAKAYTNSTVDIKRGSSWLTGIGLSLDHDYQRYVVHQSARVMYTKLP